MDDPTTVHLAEMPAERFRRAVTYLDDTLRECQLVLLSPRSDAGDPGARDVRRLAEAVVPDLEEVRDLFRTGRLATDRDRLSFTCDLPARMALTIAHLQTHMVQLRTVARRGELLTESTPEVTALLAWIWDEVADQLNGRPPRPHPADAADRDN